MRFSDIRLTVFKNVHGLNEPADVEATPRRLSALRGGKKVRPGIEEQDILVPAANRASRRQAKAPKPYRVRGVAVPKELQPWKRYLSSTSQPASPSP